MMSCLPSLTGVGADGMWPLSSRIYCGAETLEPKRRVTVGSSIALLCSTTTALGVLPSHNAAVRCIRYRHMR